LHRFKDTTTFSVHVTGCDLEKSFIIKKTWNYKPRVLSDSCVNISSIIHAVFPEVWEIERFQSTKVACKVIQCHW